MRIFNVEMKAILSIIISLTFLLQSFATVQAMTFKEGKMEMPCMLKKQVSKAHTCCVLSSAKEKQSEKKNCCSGTSKMSCCLVVFAITPPQYTFTFIANENILALFGHQESQSIYDSTIFHPPILA